MPPRIISEIEEATFLNGLLDDLDNSFSAAPLVRPPAKVYSAGAMDMESFLEGADDWNLDMDPLTPKKPSPKKKRHVQTRTPAKRHQRSEYISPSKVFSAGHVDLDVFLDGAEHWNLDSDPFTPKKPSTARIKIEEKVPTTCTRCIVESISECDSGGKWQKRLYVNVQGGEERRMVTLYDDWVSTIIHPGDIINVLGEFHFLLSSSSSITQNIDITTLSNLLVLHPDLLFTATSLSNSAECRRKPLLSSLIRSSGDTTPALVWGNILHDVMQTCLTEGQWDDQYISDRIDESVGNNLMELVKLQLTKEQAKREVNVRARGLPVFASRYLSSVPKSDAVLTDTRNKSNQKSSLLGISKLLDVEEDIWSPTYGLKGKLDATVQATIMESGPSSPLHFSNKGHSITTRGPFPFEIKTGRAVAGREHRAQTMLYTLLAAERYGVPVTSGLLYYTQSDEVVRVPAGRNELRGLISARNEMAAYAMRRYKHTREKKDENENPILEEIEEPFLPPTIDDERVCKRCYELDACMLYRKTTEAPVPQTSPIHDTYELKTSHLTSSQAEFFKKWENLLSMEEHDLARFKKELWAMSAREREKNGRCFAEMVLDVTYIAPPLDTRWMPSIADNRLHRYTYRFIRSKNWIDSRTGNLLSGLISVGDAIIVSVEPRLLALARGFIVALTPNFVDVGVDHVITPDNIAMRLSGAESVDTSKETVFRIDKDELFGGMNRIRGNLAQLFYADGDARRLALVVDLKVPIFVPSSVMSAEAERHVQHLNDSQRLALEHALRAEDYALILGMPGTGKTTVIAALIRVLVDLGKTVLLTSYTHSAVDNILAKLDGSEFGILRLGNIDKVHPDTRKYTLAERRVATTVEQLEFQLMTPPVVATTCLSVDHALFTRRTFDICIVDEASQITLPTCLGPLRYAKSFILVGDHFQLPPLVRNKDARKGGLDVSLFRRLSDAHPSAVATLTHQYRMNTDIMLLSNHLIYNCRLQVGNEEVGRRALVLPNRKFLNHLHENKGVCESCASGCWIEQLAKESCKAVFVDTDLLPAHDSRVGGLVQNEIEASLVYQITMALIQSGVRESEIGIITLYRQQVKVLAHLLESRTNVEVLTADRSQGRDKDCIIVSMVRSNDSSQIGDLLKDWRRINVSFTRARSKLVIFGSRKTLASTPLLADFLSLMDRQGWILPLFAGAEKVHLSAFQSEPGGAQKRGLESANAIASVTRNKECMDEENRAEMAEARPVKKKRVDVGTGILAGRPVLQDLVNDML